jgi:hypothetical protein
VFINRISKGRTKENRLIIQGKMTFLEKNIKTKHPPVMTKGVNTAVAQLTDCSKTPEGNKLIPTSAGS